MWRDWYNVELRNSESKTAEPLEFYFLTVVCCSQIWRPQLHQWWGKSNCALIQSQFESLRRSDSRLWPGISYHVCYVKYYSTLTVSYVERKISQNTVPCLFLEKNTGLCSVAQQAPAQQSRAGACSEMNASPTRRQQAPAQLKAAQVRYFIRYFIWCCYMLYGAWKWYHIWDLFSKVLCLTVAIYVYFIWSHYLPD